MKSAPAGRVGEAVAIAVLCCLLTGITNVGLTLLEEEARHRAKQRRKQVKKARKAAK